MWMNRRFAAVFWKTDMRICIVYSSRTGNTRAVGEYLAGRFSLPLFSVADAPCEGYDGFVLGFWTWRGGPDEAMLAFMERLQGKPVFYFGTMTSMPDSPHAGRCALRTDRLLAEGGCRVLGHFFCQGRLDPQVLARSTHPRTPERMARLKEAERHPNMQDFMQAEESLREAFAREYPQLALSKKAERGE